MRGHLWICSALHFPQVLIFFKSKNLKKPEKRHLPRLGHFMVIFVMWCVLYYTPFLVNLLSGKISIGLHLQKVACPQRVDFWSLVHIPPQEVVEICFEISKMSQPRHYILLNLSWRKSTLLTGLSEIKLKKIKNEAQAAENENKGFFPSKQRNNGFQTKE